METNIDIVVTKLKEQNQLLVNTLQGIINSCAHPDIAIRCVMVDLKPIRSAIKQNQEIVSSLTVAN